MAVANPSTLETMTRRTFIGGLAGTGLLVSAAHARHGRTHGFVGGRVTTRSANGRTSGWGGVLISNGRDVVATAADGTYKLPIRSGDCAFIVKPTGFRACSDRPFWQHFPDASGSHQLDFALEEQSEPTCFDVLLCADSQAASREELEFVRQDLHNAVRASRPAFAIHHGDITGDDLSLLPEHLRLVRETGIDWHHCPGNHDMDGNAVSTQTAFQTWTQLAGPLSYAFEYGGTLFLILNNVAYADPSERKYWDQPYRGEFGPDQIAFIEALLAATPRDQLVVASMHIPLTSFESDTCETSVTSDREAFLRLLATRPHAVSFSGHSHTTEHHYFGQEFGFDQNSPHHHQVLTAVCGGWWSGRRGTDGVPSAESRDGTPRGHHILSIDGSRARVRFVSAADNSGDPMRLMLGLSKPRAPHPALVPASTLNATDLSQAVLMANIFDGGPRTSATLKIVCAQSGTCLNHQAMPKVVSIDPYVSGLYAGMPELCKPWLEAAPSSHIWQAALPSDLAAGSYTAQVTVRAENGTMHESKLSFAVVEFYG